MYTQVDNNNPVDKLAFFLSECHNDNAPIGWERYRFLAELLIRKFPIYDIVMDVQFLNSDFQCGRRV